MYYWFVWLQAGFRKDILLPTTSRPIIRSLKNRRNIGFVLIFVLSIFRSRLAAFSTEVSGGSTSDRYRVQIYSGSYAAVQGYGITHCCSTKWSKFRCQERRFSITYILYLNPGNSILAYRLEGCWLKYLRNIVEPSLICR